MAIPDGTRYAAEIEIMRYMGWSWAELCSTPSILLAIITERVSAQSKAREIARKRDKQKRRGRIKTSHHR
jgi:hypothetical protein